MKFLFSLLLVTGVILVAESAIFVQREHPKLGHEYQCYDPEENFYYNIGEEMKFNSEICGRKLCAGNAQKNSAYVTIQTCGVVHKESGCKLEADLALPYPDCCPRVVCSDDYFKKREKLKSVFNS